MSGEFWLSDSQWSAIEPLLPKKGSGAHRVDDRRVLSGIIHVLKSGCRWRDTPSVYGPPTTIYNRYHRWAARGLWQGLFRALVTVSPRWHSDDRQHDRQGSSFCRWRKRGAEAQAIGRSRGGRTTKIHAAADGCGRPIAIEITPGQLGDVRAARWLS